MNANKEKIGFLSASIRTKAYFSPTASVAPPKKQMLAISSMVAHLPEGKMKRAYAKIKIGQK
jgi:hypothetical protein